MSVVVDRVSLEPTRRCSKGCAFCYNGSSPEDDGAWSEGDVVALAEDAARSGVRAISFGGGEPLEWPAIFGVLARTRGTLFRSLTTNGLPLEDERVLARLLAAKPEKVHVSIHAPENPREVTRVGRQVAALADAGVRSGVNLLVRRSRLAEARAAVSSLRSAGIENDRLVLLPMRDAGGLETPTPEEVASVAGPRFQSMSCLAGCAKSERFVSIAADRTVAWCSYTRTRRPLAALTWTAVLEALDGLGLEPCAGGLVRSRRLVASLRADVSEPARP